MTTGAPRALALTDKAHDALARLDRKSLNGRFRPFMGYCSACGLPAYVWSDGVACIDRSEGINGRACPGNGRPPLRVSAVPGLSGAGARDRVSDSRPVLSNVDSGAQ